MEGTNIRTKEFGAFPSIFVRQASSEEILGVSSDCGPSLKGLKQEEKTRKEAKFFLLSFSRSKICGNTKKTPSTSLSFVQ